MKKWQPFLSIKNLGLFYGKVAPKPVGGAALIVRATSKFLPV
jgi:hypothetical protein